MSEQRFVNVETLKEKFDEWSLIGELSIEEIGGVIDETPTIDPETLPIVQELRAKLARYEQIEKEGRLVELPCKIGTPAFWRHMDCEQPYKPENCIDHEGSCDKCPHRAPTAIPIEFNYQDIPRFGKTVFLTREEAEAALKG